MTPPKMLAIVPIVLLALAGCSSPAPIGTAASASVAVATPSAAGTIVVPNVVGKEGDIAKSTISEAGLNYQWDSGNDTVLLSANWAVTGESPAAGTQVAADTQVTLKVVKTSTLPASDAPSASVAASASASADPDRTKDGLDVGGAIVACDERGKAEFPYGFTDHFILGAIEQKIVKNHWVIESEVTITNAYNAKRGAVMDCHVSGTENNPNVTTFEVG